MPLGVDDPDDNLCCLIPQVLFRWEEDILDGEVGELVVNLLGDVEGAVGLVPHAQLVGKAHTLGGSLDLHLQRFDHPDQLVFDLRECGRSRRNIGSSRPGSLNSGGGLFCLDCGSSCISFDNFPLEGEDLCLNFLGIFLIESGIVELPEQEIHFIFRT